METDIFHDFVCFPFCSAFVGANRIRPLVCYSSVKPTACQLLWKRSQNVSSLRGDARQGRGVVPGRWIKHFCKIFLFRYATPQSSLRLASSSGRGDARQGRGVVPGRWVKYFCKIFLFRYATPQSSLRLASSSGRGDARQGRGVVPGRWVKYFCKIFLFRYATPQSSLRLASSSGRGAKMSPLLEEMPGRAEESTPTPSSNETKTYSRSRL